jgi:hypothetical protein
MTYRSALALVACLAGAAVALPAREPREPHDFLRGAGLSEADLAALDRGQPVARVLDTERREVAVVGAVRIRAPRARMIARYRAVEDLKRTGVVLDVGLFGDRPAAADVNALEFEAYDLESVRECVPGDCRVRLSADGMARFRAVDWERRDWRERTASTWRDLMAGLVAAYGRRGDSALPEYHNRAEPLHVRSEFAVLYRRSADVGRLAPEAYRYVREFPQAPLEGVSNLFYWSKEDFGLKPVTSVTHLMLYDPPGARAAVAAAKQIYATHYFDAGLGFTLAMDDRAGGFYMVSVNRARTRSLMSPFRTVVRRIVRNRSRDAMEKVLTTMKTALEGTGSAAGE